MSSLVIEKSTLRGSVRVPSSKSHTLRAILFASMAEGTSSISGYLASPDTEAMISACQLFGARITREPNRLTIIGVNGALHPPEDVIQAGNSGQVLRFAGALGALGSTYTVITGDASIRNNRPVKPLLEGLSQLGAFTQSMRSNNRAPIIIRGPIHSGKATIDGEDSQPVSGLLMACAFAKGPFSLSVNNPGEMPWINLTLDWLGKMGLTCKAAPDGTHYTLPGNERCKAFSYSVPGDFSSAAYPIAAALVTKSYVTLTNIDMDDVQGDKKLIDALQSLGARIEYTPDKHSLTVIPSKLTGGRLDSNQYIDALPILAVIGCYCSSPLTIYNAAIARKKESDRIRAIAASLKQMGADIEERPDGLIVQPSALKGAVVRSHNDHRIALSLTVAALGAEGQTIVEKVECIEKSYPHFLDDMQSLGAHLQGGP